MKALRPKPILGALVALALIAAVAAGQDAAPHDPNAAPAAPTYPLSAFRAIGSSFTEGNHLPELGWSQEQIDAFVDGVRASFQGRGYEFDDAAKQVSAAMAKRIAEIEERQEQQEFAEPGRLTAYMKDMCKRFNLEQTDSGLCYAIEAPGKGNRPGPDDTVVISCAATAADGTTKLPQLSYENGRVAVSSLLPGIREGIQMMTNSSQAVFVVPPALSFGSGEWPQGVVPGTPIIFQISLHMVVSAGAKG
jgi:FKBP-type peptidyl-prolyl cis-trans isomerase FkpA